MKAVTAVVRSTDEARELVKALGEAGLRKDQMSLLAPGDSMVASERVVTSETESPGVGPALGGVVGGAAGAAGGAAVAGLLVPGMGTVLVLGALAAGVAGAVGGAVGAELETSLGNGLPKDELYVYEDALRQGRSVVIAFAADDEEARLAREVILGSGAESVDAARDRWWLGLREVEAEHYTRGGGDFARDEAAYRLGFEAANRLAAHGQDVDESTSDLRARYGPVVDDPAFRGGLARGRAHAAHRVRSGSSENAR